MIRSPKKKRSWLFLIPLLLASLMLWPPFYNFRNPEVAGIPFFYWFPLTLMLVVAGIAGVVGE